MNRLGHKEKKLLKRSAGSVMQVYFGVMEQNVWTDL